MLMDTNGTKIYETPCGKFKVNFDIPKIVHRIREDGKCLLLNEIVFHVNYAEKDFDEGYTCGLVSLETIQLGIENAKKVYDVIIHPDVKLYCATGGWECNYRDE